jgi:hypothetical protein
MCSSSRFVCIAALLVSVALPIDAARAAPDQSGVDELRAELKALEQEQQSTDKKIEHLEQRINELDGNTALSGGSLLPDSSAGQMRARGIGADAYSEASEPATTPPLDSEADRKTPAKSAAVEAVSEKQQGYFGHAFSIDTGYSYSHFSTAQLNLSGFLALDAIFLGLISLDQTTADVITDDVVVRYGFGRFQADVDIPTLYRHSNFRSGGAGGNASGLIEGSVTDSGLGDVSAGLSYRVMRETARRPDIVAFVRGKAPTGHDPFGVGLIEVPGSQGNLKIPARLSTGTGVWGAAAGVSVLKTIDPMVVFGSLTYFHNFKHHFPDLDGVVGEQPGSARIGGELQYGVGVAFALNDQSSLDASFTERFLNHSSLLYDPKDPTKKAVWQTIVGSQANVGELNLGATFSLTRHLTLLTNFGVGVTQDAPDMNVSVRLPWQF